MTTAPISTTFARPVEPIHHATVFGYDAPTTCGRVEQPKPAASAWANVTCPACLTKAPVGMRYHRLASTPIEDQLGKPCGCAACERDGAHEPACGVHADEPCDCATGEKARP